MEEDASPGEAGSGAGGQHSGRGPPLPGAEWVLRKHWVSELDARASPSMESTGHFLEPGARVCPVWSLGAWFAMWAGKGWELRCWALGREGDSQQVFLKVGKFRASQARRTTPDLRLAGGTVSESFGFPAPSRHTLFLSPVILSCPSPGKF